MDIFKVFLLLSLFSGISQAGMHCFSNPKEYAAKQTLLPPLLNNLPTYLVTDNFMVKAVTSLELKSDSIRFFFNATRGIEEPVEETVRVCASETKIEIHFPNGSQEIIEVRKPDEVFVRNLINMTKVENSRFDKLSSFVKNSRVETPSAKTSNPGKAYK